jgi:hypothetical protein
MYKYENERHKLFTEEGIKLLFALRDNVISLSQVAGVFTVEAALRGLTGDSWTMLAALDFLEEEGMIKEVKQEGYVAGQWRIYRLVGGGSYV